MKYVIRNCPCFFEENEEVNDYTCSWNGTEELACQDCTDCILKQIVELLKSPNNCRYSGKLLVFTDDILPLLDIEKIK